MSVEVEGTIKEIGEENQITEKFCKREIVVVTDEKYSQSILIQFINKSTDLPDPYSEGDKVKVSCNLQGKEWQSPKGEIKYFLSLNGWRIEKLDASNNEDSGSQIPESYDDSDEESGLPF